MKIETMQGLNGLVLTVTDEGREAQIVTYQEGSTDEQDIERFRDLLYILMDAYGPTTSRYSKQRIYISIAPGDKYLDSQHKSPGY